MRGLQWSKIKNASLKKTIFNDIKIDYDDEKEQPKLDFDLLDELWMKPKKAKKVKKKKDPNAKKKVKVRKTIEFLGEMDDDGKVGRAVKMCLGAKKKVIETAEGWRDLMYSMEIDEKMGDPAEIVDALITLSPDEENLKKFDENWKTEKFKLIDVKYFDIGERLWYYCKQIPLPKIRNNLWKMKLEFTERVEDQYRFINEMRRTYDGINGNKEMAEIFKLILHIGNHLNYGHKKNGNAAGVRLDIFDKLRSMAANPATSEDEQKRGASKVRSMGSDKYSLLMFLVNMVQTNYPELANWTTIFDPCVPYEPETAASLLIKIDCDELESQVKKINDAVKNLKQQLKRMETERERIEKAKLEGDKPKPKKKKKKKKGGDDEKKEEEKKEEAPAEPEETWEPPPAPKDVYMETMKPFLEEALAKAEKLLNDFNTTKADCLGLVSKMGEKLDDKFTLSKFWALLGSIKVQWEEAAANLQKIQDAKDKAAKEAEKKRQAKEAKERKKAAKEAKRLKKLALQAKLDKKKRPSMETLQKRGVYKERSREVVVKQMMQKQVDEELRLQNGGAQHRVVTRHASIYIARTHYKCAHCGERVQGAANLSGADETPDLPHKCFKTPYDKEAGKRTTVWMSPGVRMKGCQFNHTGPCLCIDSSFKHGNKQKDSDEQKNSKQHKRQGWLQNAHKFGTTDDLSMHGRVNRQERSIDLDEPVYSLGAGVNMLNAMDDKGQKRAMKKIQGNLRNWHTGQNSSNGKSADKFKLDDPSFWDDILSSSSSETEDEHGMMPIAYAGDMMQKKSRKNKVGKSRNGARDAMARVGKARKKRGHKRGDSSLGGIGAFGGDREFKTELSMNGKNDKKRKVSFKQTDPSGSTKQITFSSKNDKNDKKRGRGSVFLENGDNTAQRNKLPNRRHGARKSEFGMNIKPKSMLQRKSSTFGENPCAETFKLNADQAATMRELQELITQQINAIDACVEFNRKTSTLKLVLTAAQERGEAMAILEKHLGKISEANNDAMKPPVQLVFPLTDNQLKQLTNEQHLRILGDELPPGCSIGVDEGLLNLKIPADLPRIEPIHKLEKRMGVLLSLEEIATIRKDIRGDDADADSIDVLQLNDKDFFNNMVNVMRNGISFIKHKKRGVYDTRFVLVRTDRLYWKEKQQDRHEKKRSFHLTKIVTVVVGKNSKALRHEQLANIPEQCCFSVVTKKATLDLSTPTMDPIEVRKFVAYVKGFQRHFLLQHARVGSRNDRSRDDHHGHAAKHQSSKPRMSPIGQGFQEFQFDQKSLQALQLEEDRRREAAADAKNGSATDDADVEDLYAER